MATRDGLNASTQILTNFDYYPVLSLNTSGVNPTGSDPNLKYNNGTLTTTNLNVTNINGSPYILTNSINTLFPKINLTSTWVAYGDSFTAGGAWSPVWTTYLASLTGKTLINKAVSSTTSDYATSVNTATNDPVNNPAYANYSSIVMYGFNDVRNNKGLYTNFYAWTQNILSLALTLSLPQNRIQDPRDASWTKSGTWTNSPVYNFGMFTSTQNDYIEKNMGTIRYIAVRHTLVYSVNTPAKWEVRVNGTIQNTFQWNTNPTSEATPNHRTGAYIIDLGVDTPNAVVRITNTAGGGVSLNNFVDFVAGWTTADLVNARNVLFLSIPRFNFEFTGGAPWDQPTDAKRIQMNEGMEQVALMCRRVGLPVSFFRISEAQGNFYTDNIHPNPTMSNQWAKQILDNALL